ncbi:hypothetical protein [Halobaculum rubrum]|uniref:hypothetical protein n=1 Tax=Halobaculum rubrum TaxID=2872158 RepID=UPI001CA3D622|nr:hypothetical protein [Halobaculum rubrum]QZY00117.1 hypothetical protein K6T25_03145 [Halobaculum rubrum]
MSASDEGDDGSDPGPGNREVAHRVFAAEFDDADLDHSESDEERAPNYVVTPTGLRVNRLFAVGVLTEVESINEQTLRGRVVDPTGAFVTYAGQYQPDEAAFLDRTTPPAFVALTGKARTFQPEDSETVYTSVRPESFATVDADTRDRWVVSAAEATLRRVAVFAAALAMDERGDRLRARLEDAGVPTAQAAGVPLAIDHYDTGTEYLEAVRTLAVDALEVVADEREEVRPLAADPGDRGGADLGRLPELPFDFEGASAPEPVSDAAGAGDADEAGEPAEAAEPTDDDVDVAEADPGADAEPAPVESADTADTADEAGEDDSAATDTTAAGSTGASTEPAGEADVDGSEEAEREPANAAGDDLGDFDDADGGLGEFDAGGEQGATDDGGALDETDALGEFDAGGDDTADTDVDPEDFEDALSEEERREVEEEHGVEFSTGSEVPDAGESGIETPDPDDDVDAASAELNEPAEPEADDGDTVADADAVSDATPSDSTGTAASDSTDDVEDADIDLEDAVVAVMTDLDDGDGVDHDAVVAAAVERHGTDPGDAEDAIQEALMSGKCYEPGDGTLKPI